MFDIRYPGVVMPPPMRPRYPESVAGKLALAAVFGCVVFTVGVVAALVASWLLGG